MGCGLRLLLRCAVSACVKEQWDLLVVLEGFQSEPLAEALKTHFGEQTISITLGFAGPPGCLGLHAAQDLEDEAHRAAACVMAQLVAGCAPVALIAEDRMPTRRIRAMLAGRGVAIRDETGWKLSTTRAAATLVSMLRALPWDSPADAVLPRELPEETLGRFEARQAAAWIAEQLAAGLKPSSIMVLSRRRAGLMPLQDGLRALHIPAQIGEKMN